jgi:micrococcal nuclease
VSVSARAHGSQVRERECRLVRWILGAFVLLSAMAPPAAARTSSGVVDHVTDGDTIVLRGGERVRLVQIDAPEVEGAKECYGAQAAAATKALLPRGTRVRVVTDPALDQHDRYGRVLAYVWKGGSMVNLRLVRDGAAAPYFYRGDRGAYARALMAAAVAARSARKGLWGACRGAVLRPTSAISTGAAAAAGPRQFAASPSAPPASGSSGCNPHYTPCVPNSPTDLDCRDVGHRVQVVGSSDPYKLDGDGDGYGCESYG